MLFGVTLDCKANVADMGPGSNLADALPHCLLGNAYQPLRSWRCVANQIRLARIRDEAVFLECDVEINDVAVANDRVSVRHAVANDMIDRAVQDELEAVLPFARRACREVNGDEFLD